MQTSPRPEPALIKAVLQPLLDDFHHWFDRYDTLFVSERMAFLTPQAQQKVRTAKEQVCAVQSLVATMDHRAGVDMSLVVSWHHLVHECWSVALKFRQEPQAE